MSSNSIADLWSVPLISAHSASSSYSERAWYALHLKHQHESRIEKSLEIRGLDYFLPKREIVRNWSDRKKIISEPLFRGYVFANLLEEEFPDILKARGIIRILGNAPGKPTPIPIADIDALQRFVREKIKVDPFPYLKEGMRVRVKDGPFKGIEGLIDQKKKGCRIILSVELMQRSVAAEIDEALLEVCR